MIWNKMAEVLVNYSTKVNKNDQVLILGNNLASDLLTQVYKQVLKAGAHPELISSPPDIDYLFYRYASDEQLEYVSPLLKYAASNFDAAIRIKSEYNTRALSNIDGKRKATRARATKEVDQIFLQRAAKGEFNWVLTQYPTHSVAQEADMSLTEFREFLTAACKLDKEDPVGEWQDLHARQEEIVDFLNGVESFEIKSDHTNLELSTEGREWINCAGQQNFPDGEVFTGPVEDSVEGHIRFNYPGIYHGQEIRDIKLTFAQGKVVEAEATKGEDLLLSLLDTDEGSRYLGEFGIGTNQGIDKFIKNMLFDEKMGGTIHLAVGAGYPESGSENQSGIHWDMLCNMKEEGEIYADGELIYQKGKFLI